MQKLKKTSRQTAQACWCTWVVSHRKIWNDAFNYIKLFFLTIYLSSKGHSRQFTGQCAAVYC